MTIPFLAKLVPLLIVTLFLALLVGCAPCPDHTCPVVPTAFARI